MDPRKRKHDETEAQYIERLQILLGTGDRKLDEEKKKLEEEKRRSDETERRLAGTYYTTFNDLWGTRLVSFSANELLTFQRGKPPEFISQEKSKPRPYLVTLKKAYETTTIVKDDGASARTSHNGTTERERIWPCDVLGNGLKDMPEVEVTGAASSAKTSTSSIGATPKQEEESVSPPSQEEMAEYTSSASFKAPDSEIQAFGDEAPGSEMQDFEDEDARKIYGEIAHLVPASPLHASLYFNVAKWALGIKGTETDHEAVQKIIHGCCLRAGNNRIAATGLKHFVSNKIRLCSQGTHFDKDPDVMIIPLRTMDQMHNWNGEGYEALFIIGSKHTANLKQIARQVGFLDLGDTASPDEIETGRDLLQKSVLSLAESLYQSHNKPSSFFTKKHEMLIEKLYCGMKNLFDGKKKSSCSRATHESGRSESSEN